MRNVVIFSKLIYEENSSFSQTIEICDIEFNLIEFIQNDIIIIY